MAKERGASKEAERRKQSAVNQNRLATKFGDSDDSDKEKGTAAKSESSEKTNKAKKGLFDKAGKPKEEQESQTKAKTPKGSSQSNSPSPDRRKDRPN